MKLNVFLTIAAAVVAVHAQSTSQTDTSAPPTSTAGLTTCIIDCVTQSATANGCSGIADITCLCSSTQFQQDAAQCLQSECPPQDVQTALALQQQQCASVSSTSGTGSSTESNTGSSTESSTGLSTQSTTGSTSISSSSRVTTSATLSSLSSSVSSVSSRLSSSITSATSPSAPATSTPSSSPNAASAMRLAFGPSLSSMVGAGVALVGVVAGAALVL